MNKPPISIYTALRIPTDLREQAKREAKRQGRSLSNYIKYLIQRDLEADRASEQPTSPYEKRVMRETLSPKQIAKQTPARVKYGAKKKAPPKK